MDEKLEALIDRAGREEVFALVRAAGWSSGSTPPKHVWQDACRILLSAQPSA